jgi:uncharacterized membrane protein
MNAPSPAAARRLMAALMYDAGGQVCHQRADRSFAPFGRVMPVCGRCAGLYVGSALGLMAAAVMRPRRRSRRFPGREAP